MGADAGILLKDRLGSWGLKELAIIPGWVFRNWLVEGGAF
jgi:hypothetical protein